MITNSCFFLKRHGNILDPQGIESKNKVPVVPGLRTILGYFVFAVLIQDSKLIKIFFLRKRCDDCRDNDSEGQIETTTTHLKVKGYTE